MYERLTTNDVDLDQPKATNETASIPYRIGA